MTTQTKIKLENVLALLPKEVQLYYVDYNDNLDEHLDLLQECIEAKNFDTLYEKIDEWYIGSSDYEFDNILNELKEDIEYTFDIEDASEILEEFEDEIRDAIYERDSSDILGDLLSNTSNIPLRVTMYSNYDCINSHWFETSGNGGYSYKESYFGAMVDTLKLNPKKVKELLKSKGINTFGSFPNLKARDGKEYVSYQDFWQELENSSCGANLLTFVTCIEASDILKLESLSKIRIPKGNNVGLFSSFQGGGSVIEMGLLKDFDIDLSKHGLTKYDTFVIEIDKGTYSINNVYGVTSNFWGNTIEILD